jgi:thiol:disulfide interchange protein
MAPMPPPWRKRFELLKTFGFVALLGLIFLIAAFLASAGVIQATFLAVGFLAVAPGMFYLVLYTIWHWKARYRGRHSDLWGALLLIETSGWFKVVYLFRHIIPDARCSGRYANSEPLVAPPDNTGESSGGMA